MKASKIIIIQEYLKQYQPTLININKVIKKKDNPSNITEQKTYIIPIKDITFPIKRKIPKVKKIYLS